MTVGSHHRKIAVHPIVGLVCALFVVPAVSIAAPRAFENEYVIERGAAARSASAQRVLTLHTAGSYSKVKILPDESGSDHPAPDDRCAELMAGDQSIRSCSPNYRKKLYDTPDDPFFRELWAFDPAYTGSISAQAAWGLHHGSSAGVVAVVDTGIDYLHPDLVQNMWRNPGEIAGNGIDDDSNGYVDDVYGISVDPADPRPYDRIGHGTHIAGIIAAGGNNSIGVTGVNWSAQLIAVHFIDDTRGSLYDLLTALQYVLDLKLNRGVDIVAVNASFGSSFYSQPEFNMLRQLRDAGILVIAAAGNEQNNNDEGNSYPAAYPLENIIAVAALAPSGALASFSNYGATSVHLAAPGVSIFSTFAGGGYARLTGTSMAAPFVTGAAALLHSYLPGLDMAALRNAIIANTAPLPGLGGRVTSGGALDLRGVLTGIPPVPGGPPTAGGAYRLTAANLRNGSRRIAAGAPILLDITPVPGNSGSAEAIELTLSFNGATCPQKIRAISRGRLAAVTRLPNALGGMRPRFSVVNAAGQVTGSDYVKIIRGSRSVQRNGQEAVKVCRDFASRTKMRGE